MTLQMWLSMLSAFVPLIVVVLQIFTKKKVNEIHVLVNSEHAALVKSLAEANATLVTANAMIVRLISVIPERAPTIPLPTGS